MAYEAEEVYEYDDPLEFEIERLKYEAGSVAESFHYLLSLHCKNKVAFCQLCLSFYW